MAGTVSRNKHKQSNIEVKWEKQLSSPAKLFMPKESRTLKTTNLIQGFDTPRLWNCEKPLMVGGCA